MTALYAKKSNDDPSSFLSFLPEIGRRIAIGFFIVILGMVVIAAPLTWYWYREPIYADIMPLFFGIALLVVLGAAYGASQITKVRHQRDRITSLKHISFGAKLVIAMIFIACLQVFIVRFAFFITDWDVGHITWRYDEGQSLVEYLSIYPFQRFIVGIFQLIGPILGPPGSNGYYLAAVGLGVISVDIALVLLTLTVQELLGSGWGWLSFGLGVWFIGISPWILVPYTDTIAMPYTVAILYLYTVWLPRVSSKPLLWGIITFVGVIGYAYKAQVIFAYGVVVAVSLCRTFSRSRHEYHVRHYKKVPTRSSGAWKGVTTVLGCLIGGVLAFGITGAISIWSVRNLAVKDGIGLGLPHYLMMGSNSGGAYAQEDVDLSLSYSSPQERTQKNLQVWQERLQAMGIGGTTELIIHKVLETFGSGSFSWGQESDKYFFTSFPVPGLDIIHTFYGMPSLAAIEAGELDPATSYNGQPAHAAPYFVISQVIWLAILLCLALNVFDPHPKDPTRVAFITLLALGLFLLIFECRARYLIIYLPYFCLLGATGLRALSCRLLLLNHHKSSFRQNKSHQKAMASHQKPQHLSHKKYPKPYAQCALFTTTACVYKIVSYPSYTSPLFSPSCGCRASLHRWL